MKTSFIAIAIAGILVSGCEKPKPVVAAPAHVMTSSEAEVARYQKEACNSIKAKATKNWHAVWDSLNCDKYTH